MYILQLFFSFRMSTEDIAICSLCQMTFPSHEAILVHTCDEIKEEKIEEIIDHSEIIANENFLNQEDFKNRNCLDLSEEFLIFILKQVDDLCENIKTGDPDIERRFKVNQNLNNAVAFYRSKLDLKKHILVDTDQNADIRVESDDENEDKYVLIDSKALEENQTKLKSPSNKDILHYSKVSEKKVMRSKAPEENKKGRRKSEEINNENHQPQKNHNGRKGRLSKRITDEKFELVKNQCGRHSVQSMAVMLNMGISTLHDKIRKDGIIFQKRPIQYSWECQFCEMEKNEGDAKTDDLLPLLRFNQNEQKFQCSFCNFLFPEKSILVKHLRTIHRNEILAKSIMRAKSKGNQDCDGSVCKKLYGIGKGKEFWCKICSKELQLAKIMMKESKAGVCPECGILANNLSAHRAEMHYAEKQVCSLCSKEFGSLKKLNQHKQTVHEKVPCTECGKLFGLKKIKGHIQSAHTPDDQKKYRCDTCGKGFINNLRLSDHMNVHTGEKPYKCKFCSSCFASKGTHAMHERGHLGRGRKLKN